MKTLLIAYYFSPLAGPGLLRPARMAKYLCGCGHDVVVFTQGSGSLQDGETAIRRVRDVSHN